MTQTDLFRDFVNDLTGIDLGDLKIEVWNVLNHAVGSLDQIIDIADRTDTESAAEGEIEPFDKTIARVKEINAERKELGYGPGNIRT
jgi:hypothetical protein